MNDLDLLDPNESWKQWKAKFYYKPNLDECSENYKMVYNSEDEAKENFLENHNYIVSHNLQETSYKLAHNQYSDLNVEQYQTLLKGFKMPEECEKKPMLAYHSDEGVSIPASVNWVTKGAVNPIQNQGACGSCYSFSAVAAIEGQAFLQSGRLLKLSEQNGMDGSSRGYGNYGGNGGFMVNVFRYVKDHGIGLASVYPYQQRAFAGKTYHPSDSVVGLTGYVELPRGSEHALVTAIGSVGPVSVAINAGQRSFQFYSSGIYYDPTADPNALDHAVVAVGYGTVNNRDYYLVRNSWGTSWGQRGYVYMARNYNNASGIANMASYPTGVYVVK